MCTIKRLVERRFNACTPINYINLKGHILVVERLIMTKLKRFTKDEIDTIIDMYPTHHDYEIANVLNRNPKVIGDKIHILGLKGRPPASTLRTLHTKQKIEKYYGVDIKWLLNTMHWILEIPLRNGMDNILNVSSSTVKEWMIEYNIQNRSVSQDNYRRYKYMSKDDRLNQVAAAHENVRLNGQPKNIGKPGWSKGLNKNTHPGLMESSLKHMGNKNPMFNKCGTLNPNWKGGKIWWRGARWDTIKKQIKERDNYTCQECGITEDEWIKSSGQPLQVHHIELYRISKNNHPNNLTTLCNRCHTKADAINLKNYEHTNEEETWKQNKLNQYV